MLFCFAKNTKSGYSKPILGKLAVTHDLGWWLVGKPMVDFLFASIELSSLAISRFRGVDLWGKCVQFGCFRSQILPGSGSSPINHSCHQKTRNTMIPYGEDRIHLRSLILTQCRSVTFRQTDRRVCRSIYSSCKPIALRCAATKNVSFFNIVSCNW